jgi:hypothetical protein
MFAASPTDFFERSGVSLPLFGQFADLTFSPLLLGSFCKIDFPSPYRWWLYPTARSSS